MLRHIAFIMDGNGRWATERGMSRSQGHLAGYKRLREICDVCYRSGVSVVSVYALSLDNRIKRPRPEIRYLYFLLLEKVDELMAILQQNDIEFRWSGSPEGLPQKVLDKLHHLEKSQMPSQTGRFFNFAFNYSGRQEILDAAKVMIASGSSTEQLTANHFVASLYNGDLGKIDLLVRTGKEQRISDFFLWQVGNAQLTFLNLFWPDLTSEEVVKIIETFNQTAANSAREAGKGGKTFNIITKMFRYDEMFSAKQHLDQ